MVYGLLLQALHCKPPIVDNHRPLLSAKEYSAAREHVLLYFRSPLHHRHSRAGKSREPSAKAWGFIDQAIAAGDWKGAMLIARTGYAAKAKQQILRAALKAEAQRGPISRRRFFRDARGELPQAKNPRDAMSELLYAIAQRQQGYDLAVLWGEATALAAQEHSRDRLAQADKLAKHYSYLGLSASQIRDAFARRLARKAKRP